MSVLNELNEALDAKHDQSIKQILNKLSTQGTDIELTNSEIVHKLLNNTSNISLGTETVAEWAKVEHNRIILTDTVIIQSLLNLLEQSKDEDILLNVIRALGNICYENELACNLIDEKNGLDALFKVLKSDASRTLPNSAITTKACGFLMNLLVTHETLRKSALKKGIMEILASVLDRYKSNFNENETKTSLMSFSLAILNTVCDYLDEQNIVFSPELCNVIIDVLKTSNKPEVAVTCIEILHGQSEKDEIKTLLATSGICELLFDRIEQYRHEVNDEESRAVLKMACDLIVIILTGDDCMFLLYDNGRGIVYNNMISWLDSDDQDLLTTGVLAVGNFARKDIHCIEMVQNGISRKLIALLSKYNSPTSNITIQHALLSTLKNLLIPQANKSQVLQEGLIDVIYPMIKIDQLLVVFKLLGTFRMVIDNQEAAALDLISRVDFLEKIIYWCYNSDHLGIRGEVPRLLAWLIKNCHSFKPFANLLAINDSVKCLVEMIASNHAVMQNEAFYALTLLCVGCATTNANCDTNTRARFVGQLMEAETAKNLQFVVNKYGEKMDQHTVENLVALLEQLLQMPQVAADLKEVDIGGALEKLVHVDGKLKGRIRDFVRDVNQ